VLDTSAYKGGGPMCNAPPPVGGPPAPAPGAAAPGAPAAGPGRESAGVTPPLSYPPWKKTKKTNTAGQEGRAGQGGIAAMSGAGLLRFPPPTRTDAARRHPADSGRSA